MKLVIREYLASLKERDELDAVLPDLLTELGFTVYSRPARGTRQYGVDGAAVGTGHDGVRRVHMFSVKSGDFDRNEWNIPLRDPTEVEEKGITGKAARYVRETNTPFVNLLYSAVGAAQDDLNLRYASYEDPEIVRELTK